MINSEIIVQGLDLVLVNQNTSSIEIRDLALDDSKRILIVHTPEAQAFAVEAMTRLKSIQKRTESARESVKRPVLEIGRKIDSIAKDFCSPIDSELKRLNGLVSKFQQEERARVEKIQREEVERRNKIFEEEERARQALQKEADSEKDLSKKLEAFQKIEEAEKKSSVAIQESLKKEIESGPARASGMIVKRQWKFEVTNIKDLYQARPELCVIEPNNMMIRGMISGGVRECQGLRIYEDITTTVKC